MSVQDSQTPATPRVLPILEIAKDAYQLLFRHPGLFLAAMAVPLVIELLATWAFWTTYGPEMARLATAGGGDLAQPGAFLLRLFLLLLVLLIAYSLFAVAWHRLSLLDQRPGLLPAVHGRHVRFILMTYGVSLLIGIIAFLVILPLGLLKVQSQIVFLLLGLGLVLIFMRWQLAFPAIAVDRPLGLGGAWRATRGHTLRLFWLFLLVVIPPSAVRWLVDKLFEEQVGMFMVTGTLTPPAFAGLAISAIVGYVMLALLIGALSGAYRHLVLQRS
ncbi:MAG TPA: hypothetical protein VJL84_12030 [Kiloniellales bacterium]|nr:hypothetical protein [Kiloniellales bacterium]